MIRKYQMPWRSNFMSRQGTFPFGSVPIGHGFQSSYNFQAESATFSSSMSILSSCSSWSTCDLRCFLCTWLGLVLIFTSCVSNAFNSSSRAWSSCLWRGICCVLDYLNVAINEQLYGNRQMLTFSPMYFIIIWSMYLIKGLMDLPISESTLAMVCNTDLVLFKEFIVSTALNSVQPRKLTSSLGFEDNPPIYRP